MDDSSGILAFNWRGHYRLLWKTSKSGGSPGLVAGISRQSDLGMGVLGHMPRQFIRVRMSRRGEDGVGIGTCDCPVGAD